jgi:hypothetical protein
MTTVLSHKSFESSSGGLNQPAPPSGLIETPGYHHALPRPRLKQGLCLRWHARTPLPSRIRPTCPVWCPNWSNPTVSSFTRTRTKLLTPPTCLLAPLGRFGTPLTDQLKSRVYSMKINARRCKSNIHSQSSHNMLPACYNEAKDPRTHRGMATDSIFVVSTVFKLRFQGYYNLTSEAPSD